MRGVVATKGGQSASEHPAAVHGALLTPCHYDSHYQSSKLANSNRTPQIAPLLITFHIRESAISFLPSNATNFQDQNPNAETSKPNIDRYCGNHFGKQKKIARSDVDQTLANPNAT